VKPGYRVGVNPSAVLEIVARKVTFRAPRDEAFYRGPHAGSDAVASSVAISAFVLGIFLMLEGQWPETYTLLALAIHSQLGIVSVHETTQLTCPSLCGV
jgi:divalent metal cation (Fe/Co/Zn/Cd) transporter